MHGIQKIEIISSENLIYYSLFLITLIRIMIWILKLIFNIQIHVIIDQFIHSETNN